jgi:hypothetical protein
MKELMVFVLAWPSVAYGKWSTQADKLTTVFANHISREVAWPCCLIVI